MNRLGFVLGDIPAGSYKPGDSFVVAPIAIIWAYSEVRRYGCPATRHRLEGVL